LWLSLDGGKTWEQVRRFGDSVWEQAKDGIRFRIPPGTYDEGQIRVRANTFGMQQVYGVISGGVDAQLPIKYWSGDKGVDIFNVKFFSQAQLDRKLDKNGILSIENSRIDESTRSVTSEVWLNLNESTKNIDFQINSSYSQALFVPEPSRFQSWTTDTNNGSFSAVTLGSGLNGKVMIGTLLYGLPLYPISISDNRSEFISNQISLTRGNIGKASLIPEEFTYQLRSDSYQGIRGVEPDKVTGIHVDSIAGANTSSAITSLDTLYALQLAVGLIDINELNSPLQLAAADVDRNGLIQAKDALLINRFVASSSSSINNDGVGSWRFIKSDTDLSNFSLESTLMINDPSEIRLQWPLTKDQTLTGVLLGDIDGSWSL